MPYNPSRDQAVLKQLQQQPGGLPPPKPRPAWLPPPQAGAAPSQPVPLDLEEQAAQRARWKAAAGPQPLPPDVAPSRYTGGQPVAPPAPPTALPSQPQRLPNGMSQRRLIQTSGPEPAESPTPPVAPATAGASAPLDPQQEAVFREWYAGHANRIGLNPDPDNPLHFYDYRAAWQAGAGPNAENHWPSEFKREGHPRMVVDGVNTKTGEPVAPPAKQPARIVTIPTKHGPFKIDATRMGQLAEVPEMVKEGAISSAAGLVADTGGAVGWLGTPEKPPPQMPEGLSEKDALRWQLLNTPVTGGSIAKDAISKLAGEPVRAAGKAMTEWGGRVSQEHQAPPDIGMDLSKDLSLLANPKWLAYYGTSAFVSSLPFMVPGMTGAALAGKLARTAKWGPAIEGIARTIGGDATGTVVESLIEAGGARNTALQQGQSEDAANEIASDVFKKNLALIGITGLVFPFEGKEGAGLIRRTLRRAGESGIEGVQEGGQGVIQGEARRTYDPDYQYNVGTDIAMGVMGGAVTGAVLEKAGDAFNQNVSVGPKDLPEVGPEGGPMLDAVLSGKAGVAITEIGYQPGMEAMFAHYAATRGVDLVKMVALNQGVDPRVRQAAATALKTVQEQQGYTAPPRPPSSAQPKEPTFEPVVPEETPGADQAAKETAPRIFNRLLQEGFSQEGLTRLGVDQARQILKDYSSAATAQAREAIRQQFNEATSGAVSTVPRGTSQPSHEGMSTAPPRGLTEQLADVRDGRARAAFVPRADARPGLADRKAFRIISTPEGTWYLPKNADPKLLRRLAQAKGAGDGRRLPITPEEIAGLTKAVERKVAPAAPATATETPAVPATPAPAEQESPELRSIRALLSQVLAKTGYSSVEEAERQIKAKGAADIPLTADEIKLLEVAYQLKAKARYKDTEGERRRQAPRDAPPKGANETDAGDLTRENVSKVLADFTRANPKEPVWYVDGTIYTSTPEAADAITDAVVDASIRQAEQPAEETTPPTGTTPPPPAAPTTADVKYALPEPYRKPVVHGFGKKKVPVTFESELEHGLYLVGSRYGRSPSDHPLVASLMAATGQPEAWVRAAGKYIVKRVNGLARDAGDGEAIHLPASGAAGRPAQPGPAATSPPAVEPSPATIPDPPEHFGYAPESLEGRAWKQGYADFQAGVPQDKTIAAKAYHQGFSAAWEAKLRADREAAKKKAAETKPAEQETIPDPERAPLEPVLLGAIAKARAKGMEVEAQWALLHVRGHGLLTSFDAGYNDKLQPRTFDVERRAYLDAIIKDFHADQLFENIEGGLGAPVIGDDGDTEGGNGRLWILREIYSNPALKHLADAYREEIIAQAEKLGLKVDPEQVRAGQFFAGRIRRTALTPAERVTWVEKLNEKIQQGDTATEQAKQDARKLTAAIGDMFHPGEDGKIETEANADFIREWISAVVGRAGAKEISSEGVLTVGGVTRIRNAMFAWAYGVGKPLAMISETAESNIKSILDAMVVAAGPAARVKAGVDKGGLYPRDITVDREGQPSVWARAIMDLSRLRASNTIGIDKEIQRYLDQETQESMFGDKDDARLIKTLVKLLGEKHQNFSSVERVAALIKEYSAYLEAMGRPDQMVMPGMMAEDVAAITREDILNRAIIRIRRENGEPGEVFLARSAKKPKDAGTSPPVPAEGKGKEKKPPATPAEFSADQQKRAEGIGRSVILSNYNSKLKWMTVADIEAAIKERLGVDKIPARLALNILAETKKEKATFIQRILGPMNAWNENAGLDQDDYDRAAPLMPPQGYPDGSKDEAGFVLGVKLASENKGVPASIVARKELPRTAIAAGHKAFEDAWGQPAAAPEEVAPETPTAPTEEAPPDDLKKFFDELPDDDEPPVTKLKTGEGTLGMGFSPKLVGVLGSSLYGGQRALAIVRETIQNAVDGVRALAADHAGGKKVRIYIGTAKGEISVSDTGAGMSPETVETALTNLGESDKPAGGAGAFGVAKAVILGSAQTLYIRTVWRDPAGAYWLSKVEGGRVDGEAAAEQWVRGTLKYSSEKVKSGPTGTEVSMTLAKDSSPSASRTSPTEELKASDISGFLNNSLRFHMGPGELEIVKDGTMYEVDRPELKPSPTVKDMAGGTVTLHESVAREKAGSYNGGVSVKVLNNGVYQFDDAISAGLPGVEGPAFYVADISATVDPGSTSYPFRTDRAGLSYYADRELAHFATKIQAGLREERNQLAIRTIKEATKIDGVGPSADPYHPIHVIVDPHERLTRAFIGHLAKRPYIRALSMAMEDVTRSLQDTLAGTISGIDRAMYSGLTLDPDLVAANYSASKLFGDQSNTNLVFVNPFAAHDEARARAEKGEIEPSAINSEISAQLVDSLIHELAHQASRKHDETFAGAMTRVLGRVIRLQAGGDFAGHMRQIEAAIDGAATTSGETSAWEELKDDAWANSRAAIPADRTSVLKDAGTHLETELRGERGEAGTGRGEEGRTRSQETVRPDERVAEGGAPGPGNKAVPGGPAAVARAKMLPGPILLKAVQYGAGRVEAGLTGYNDWAANMEKAFGPKSRPFLRGIWKAIKTRRQDLAKGMTDEATAKGNAPEKVPPADQPDVAGGPDAGAPGAGGAGQAFRSLVTARPQFTKPADEVSFHQLLEQQLGKKHAAQIWDYLRPEQRQAAAKAHLAMSNNTTGNFFILADGTGAGKTATIFTVASIFAAQGHPVLIVAPAGVLKIDTKTGKPTGSYEEASAKLGIDYLMRNPHSQSVLKAGTITIDKYNTFNPMVVTKDTIIINDESHALKNVGMSDRATRGILAADNAKAVMYVTATPFDKPHHFQYMNRVHKALGMDEESFMKRLGFKKYPVPQPKPGERPWNWGISDETDFVTVLRAIEMVSDDLTALGTMIKRELSMDEYEVIFHDLLLPPDAHSVLDDIYQAFGGLGARGRKAMVRNMHLRLQQEPYKLGEIMRLTNQELAEGRQVIVYISRVNESEAALKEYGVSATGERILISKDVIHASEGTAKSLKKMLKDVGVSDVVELHRGKTDNSEQHEDITKFNSGKARVMIATLESGEAGISLDDTVGNAPRTIIITTPPFNGISLVQALGRILRITTKSNQRAYLLFSDHWIDAANRSVTAAKVSTLKAVVKGEIGRMQVDKDGRALMADRPARLRAAVENAEPRSSLVDPTRDPPARLLSAMKFDKAGSKDARAAIHDLVKDAMTKPVDIGLHSGKGPARVTFLVHPDVVNEGSVRVTTAYTDGAWGYQSFPSLDAAVDAIHALVLPGDTVKAGRLDKMAESDDWGQSLRRGVDRDANDDEVTEATRSIDASDPVGLDRLIRTQADADKIRGEAWFVKRVEELMERIIVRNARLDKGVLGEYFMNPSPTSPRHHAESIEVKGYSPWKTVIHEVGHHMHTLLYGKKQGGGGLLAKSIKETADNGPGGAVIQKEIVALLADYGRGYQSATLKAEEAYAEWIRMMATMPGEAFKRAPYLTARWSADMKANKSLTSLLSFMKGWHDQYANASLSQRFGSRILRDSSMKIPLTQVRIFMNLTDSGHPLKAAFQQMLDQLGLPPDTIDPAQDVRKMADTMKASVAMAVTRLTRGTFKFATPGLLDGVSLLEALDPVKGRELEFEKYLIAREIEYLGRPVEQGGRGWEDTFKYFGVPKAEVDVVLGQYRKDPDMNEAFDRMQRWWDASLQYWRDAGFFTQERYLQIKNSNLVYTPLYRIHFGTSTTPGGIGGQKLGNLWSTVKRRWGSQRPFVSPIQMAVNLTFAQQHRIERNEVLKAFVKMGRIHPNGGFWGTEAPDLPMEPIKVSTKEAFEQLGIDPADLGLAVDEKSQLTFWRESVRDPKDQMVWFWEEGKRKAYQFRDPTLYRSIQSLDRTAMLQFVKVFRGAVRLGRALIVLGPTFVGNNLTRDQAAAVVKSQRVYKIWRFPKNWTESAMGFDLPRSILGALGAKNETIALWNDQTARLRDGLAHKRFEPQSEKMLRAGAGMGLWFEMSPDDAQRFVQHELLGEKQHQHYAEMKERLADRYGEWHVPGWKKYILGLSRPALATMDGFLAARDWLENVGLTVEQATRMQEAMSHGLATAQTRGEMIRAGHAARILTVDFGRVGLWTKHLADAVMFLNPKVQGISNDYQALVHRKDKLVVWGRIARWLMLPIMSLFMYNRDDERYWATPDYIRKRYMVWYPPKSWTWMPEDVHFKISKAQGPLGLIQNGIESLLSWYFKHEPDAGETFYKAAIDELMLKEFMPMPNIQLTNPITENYYDWKKFYDRGVKSGSMDYRVPEEQWNSQTSEVAKLLAAGTSKIPGVKAFMPEGLRSPQLWDNALRGYLPGIGESAIKGIDILAGKAGLVPEKPERGVETIPFVGAFVGQLGFNTANISRVYDLHRIAAKAHTTYGDDEDRAIAAGYGKELDWYGPLTEAIKEIRQWKKDADEIRLDPDMTGSQKRAEILSYTKAANDTATGALELLGKAGKARDISLRGAWAKRIHGEAR